LEFFIFIFFEGAPVFVEGGGRGAPVPWHNGTMAQWHNDQSKSVGHMECMRDL